MDNNPAIDPTDIGPHLADTHTAIRKAIDLYLDNVPADQIDRELLAETVYECLSDELDRLYRNAATAAHPAEPQLPGKRYRITNTHLVDVAAIYAKAYGNGQGPTRAVASHFGVSHSTAAKWVGRARKAGLLPRWAVVDNIRMGATS